MSQLASLPKQFKPRKENPKGRKHSLSKVGVGAAQNPFLPVSNKFSDSCNLEQVPSLGSSQIMSPHHYRPNKKLFYVTRGEQKAGAKGNHRNKSVNHNGDKNGERVVRDGNAKGMNRGLFSRHTSPNERANTEKIASTKSTTEEAEDVISKNFNDFFSQNKNNSKMPKFYDHKKQRIQVKHTESSADEDLFKNTESIDTIQKISNQDNSRQKIPSIKDITADNSCSTIEKIIPSDLLEDSLNTCSIQKPLSYPPSAPSSGSMPPMPPAQPFMSTLNQAITYFSTSATSAPQPASKMFNYDPADSLIEDSMNKASIETPASSKVAQLEAQVKDLQGIITKERAKNKELQSVIESYQQILNPEGGNRSQFELQGETGMISPSYKVSNFTD